MSGANEHRRMEAVVHGNVQGVGFRHHTVTTARQLGDVHGWVRNRADGNVDVVAEGPEGQLRSLLDALRNGPPRAEVTDIDTAWKEPEGGLQGFNVKH